jgi:pyruvate dehydrogenase E2 component (dihydrolipoamide acetyltransferase)
MPKLGLTMKSGKVGKWFKAQGDAVVKGEDLLEVETDKITNKVEAPESGILYQIVVPAKTEALVGAVLAVIAEPGEQPEMVEGGAAPAAAPEKKAAAKEAKAAPAAGAPRADAPASPAARRLAREHNIDLSQVAGSGPDGRITEKDVMAFHEAVGKIKITPLAAVLAAKAGLDLRSLTGTGEGGKITREDVNRALNPEAAAEAAPPTAAATPESGVMPIGGMRLAIAQNMSMSLQNAAQLTLMTEVDVTRCEAFLADIRAAHKKDASFRVSMNDVLILAASRALKKFPRMNSTSDGENIYLHEAVNMGIAVALPEGLIVPVLPSAHTKGLEQIAKESREIAGRARAGTLAPDEVTGGTFTISNMGRSVVDFFTPILKPGETGILGVGRVVEKAVVENGQIVVRPMMGLSLTFDHRVLDGSPAADFLGVLCDFIQNPAVMVF